MTFYLINYEIMNHINLYVKSDKTKSTMMETLSSEQQESWEEAD